MSRKAPPPDDANASTPAEQYRPPGLLAAAAMLLEICRVKCSPSDEIILPGGISNQTAMILAQRDIEAARLAPYPAKETL
jgi:hypothetical protein